jgi:hypothetical protein
LAAPIRSSSAARERNGAAWGAVVAGLLSLLSLPAAIEASRRLEGLTLTVAVGIGAGVGAFFALVAISLGRRARFRSERTLGRVGGVGVARAGRLLGIVGLLVAITAGLALGFFGLLVLLE